MKNLIPIVILFFISCSKDNNSVTKNSTVIENYIDIRLKDLNGNNIFNNSTYTFSSMSVKYLVNGSVISPPYAGTQPILLDDVTFLPYGVRIFLNNTETEEYPLTYIKWNSTDTDTIKAHFNRGNSNGQDYEILDKVWINNNIVTSYIEPGHYVNLVK